MQGLDGDTPSAQLSSGRRVALPDSSAASAALPVRADSRPLCCCVSFVPSRAPGLVTPDVGVTGVGGQWGGLAGRSAALATTLPLVAVTAADEVVRALLAQPPPNVIEQFLDARPRASAEENMRTIAGAIISLVKLRALAVDPTLAWPRNRVGSADPVPRRLPRLPLLLPLRPVPRGRCRSRRLQQLPRLHGPAARRRPGPVSHFRRRWRRTPGTRRTALLLPPHRLSARQKRRVLKH